MARTSLGCKQGDEGKLINHLSTYTHAQQSTLFSPVCITIILAPKPKQNGTRDAPRTGSSSLTNKELTTSVATISGASHGEDGSRISARSQISLTYYLTGVRGLLLRRRGDRSLGWKEKPSLMLSNTEGAT